MENMAYGTIAGAAFPSISRWILLTARFYEAGQATGDKFAVEKNRVSSFGDGYIVIEPKFFHANMSEARLETIKVKESAAEILKLLETK